MVSTPFVETEALLAVLEGRPEDAEEILSGFLPGELVGFSRQLRLLDDLIGRVARRRLANPSKPA